MELFEELGRIALGTRVRFLGDRITDDAAKIYGLYGIEMNPKWFPVFYVLTRKREPTITAIAEEIGHSHVSVSKIVAEMTKARLVTQKTSQEDRRRTLVTLTTKGEKIADAIEEQYVDVRNAVEELSRTSKNDLWKALAEWEALLSEKSLFERVREKKLARGGAEIRIVPYEPKHRSAFRKLNTEWITIHFKMEKADHDALDDPQGYILDRGGFIFVALEKNRVVGVCALLRHDEGAYPFELAKMAVAKEARGKGVGFLLGRAVIEKARSLKAKRLYLESNTRLKPALGLYRKLGFKDVAGLATPYERCNVQMELRLDTTTRRA